MKTIIRILAVLLLTAFTTAGSGTAWASSSDYKGVWLGRQATDDEVDWDFSLVNLTQYNVVVGAKPDKGAIGDNFPYGHSYPPGNSQNKTMNLTTWKGGKGDHPFPKVSSTNVDFAIQDGTNQYGFSVNFLMPGSEGTDAYATLQSPSGSAAWKYSVTNDNGFYADPPRDGYSEGVLFAISDKYTLCIYKPVTLSHGGNKFFLVVSQRYTYNSQHNVINVYQGNHLQWPMP